MSTYECTTCGKPFCIFIVPDIANDRIDLPTICPWKTVEDGKKKSTKKAKWRGA